MPKTPKTIEHDTRVKIAIEDGYQATHPAIEKAVPEILDAILHTLNRIATALEHRL